jgi:hypothetical protein
LKESIKICVSIFKKMDTVFITIICKYFEVNNYIVKKKYFDSNSNFGLSQISRLKIVVNQSKKTKQIYNLICIFDASYYGHFVQAIAINFQTLPLGKVNRRL